MGDLCDGLHIGNLRVGITQRLYVERPRVLPDGFRKLFRPQRIHKSRGDAVIRQRVRQQIVRAAVKILRRHDMPAAERHILYRIGHCRRPGRRGDRSRSSFQGSHTFLEDLHSRIGQTGINIAFFPEGEPIRRMFRIMKNVGRGLVDRHRPGVCRRVRRLLSHM